MIDDYIYFYNHERIQTKTGVAPLMLRTPLEINISYIGGFVLSAQTGAVHSETGGFSVAIRHYIMRAIHESPEIPLICHREEG